MNKLPTVSSTGWLNKVPEVALSFWIIKIMSTTVGETGADFLAVNAGWGQGVTRTVMAALLAAALFMQLRTRRYTPWIYWLTVVLVSVVGTQITDLLTDGLGVSLYISTSVFAVALAAIFFVWYRVERTLSIHDIVTRSRELFYWAAILCTFALGTAAADAGNPVATAARAQCVDKVHQNTRTAAANRVPKGNGAAVDVHAFFIPPGNLAAG